MYGLWNDLSGMKEDGKEMIKHRYENNDACGV